MPNDWDSRLAKGRLIKRKPFALVSAKEYSSIPYLFILRVLKTKNCFSPNNPNRSRLNKSQVRKPRKESRPRLLRFPPKLRLTRSLPLNYY